MPAASPEAARLERRLRVLGGVCLALGALAALELSLRHLGLEWLPGCGLDSPCQRAISGEYGTLPVLRWPVAFAGASYFASLLAAWLTLRGAWPRGLRWVVRAGALLSVTFLGLAVASRTYCPFCLAAQAANLAFWIASERAPSCARARSAEVCFLLTAVLTTSGLGLARWNAGASSRSSQETALQDSTAAVLSGRGARAFTGRQRRGPEDAALRLVFFTDYQCPDCQQLEREAEALLAERSDLSLSVKHFPLCRDCNRRARELGRNPHPNACWAARAVEAAGLVAGADSFWRMHDWLFARGGAFVDADLRAGLVQLGIEQGPFLEALHGGESLARVQADVDEALALGVQNTPTVFLNGVELRGWQAPQALRRALEALATTNPAARGPESDHPPGALDKILEDWRLEPVVVLPARPGEERAAGDATVALWGDYLDAGTRELDLQIRALLAAHARVRYSFRHYPLDTECASGASNLHPGACRAARAAEAARVLGGEPAFGRFHAWLFSAGAGLTDEALAAGAREAGVDPAALLGALGSEASVSSVRADIEDARRLGIGAIPFLFVNGKRVARWRLDGADLLERLLVEALRRD